MNTQKLLDDSALKSYKQNGFYLQKNLFKESQIKHSVSWLQAQDQKSLAKSWTEQEPGVDLAVLSIIHKGQDPLAEIANDKTMLQMASEFMNSDIYIWSSKVNMKAAWCGTVEYMHQDFVYWKDRGYPSDRMMTCIVFLEPHSFANGGLCVFPGSHQNGFIEHTPFININGLSKNMIAPETLTRLHREHGMLAIEASPGDVLFFHTCLVHGSSHNTSPYSRKLLLSQLNAVGNEPIHVAEKTKAFNLSRAEMELKEAKRRLDWFQKKYDEQKMSNDITFCPPIPDHEKGSY